MADDPQARQRRLRWCGVAVAVYLPPALLVPPSAYPLAVMAVAATVVAVLVWPIRRVSLAQAAVGASVASVALDFGYFGDAGLVLLWFPFETAALLVLLVRVIRHVPAPLVGAVSGLTGAAVVLLPSRFTLQEPGIGLKESVLAVSLAFFPAACASGVGLYLRSLDNRRARAVVRARREQRLEVARDLHDFVAHEVTGIVLEAQAAQLEDLGPREYRELLTRVERAGLRALGSMDQTVSTLRTADGRWGEPPPTRLYGLADLPELAERFGEMSTAAVELHVEQGLLGSATAAPLSREAADTAYRVVLEALTNVRRHAPQAARVEILAARTADAAVEITVTDTDSADSTDSAAASPRADSGGARADVRYGGGTGLAGLAERVGALDGRLDAGPHSTGWRVSCLLPESRKR